MDGVIQRPPKAFTHRTESCLIVSGIPTYSLRHEGLVSGTGLVVCRFGVRTENDIEGARIVLSGCEVETLLFA